MSDTRTSDTRTNDARPKRAAREPTQAPAPIGQTAVNQTPVAEISSGETIVAEAVAAVTTPIIERQIVPEPDPVSTIALAQAVPSGPACPVPAAPERLPSDQPPASDKSPETAAETGWTAFTEAQAALAHGFAKAAVEMNGVSRSGIAATADAAVALLGARTLAEALEINAALARRGFDTMFEASARLSEIGAEAFVDASRPMLSRYVWPWRGGRGWDALGLS